MSKTKVIVTMKVEIETLTRESKELRNIWKNLTLVSFQGIIFHHFYLVRAKTNYFALNLI